MFEPIWCIIVSMRIEWNKVTWYSKLGAIILFIFIVPILCFYIGMRYEQTREVVSINEVNKNDTTEETYYNRSALPVRVGQCIITSILKVENRLQEGENGPFIEGSGSAIEYSNKGYQVSYDQIPAMDDSRAGDEVKLCLVSLPKDCPPGDDRGRFYDATNLRTGESWEAPDAEHMCGGA